ncbi:4-(cytidine 5'-diphospho)-2-C-methyl-D-erythritol kinase [Variovorax sp. LG9.2]|jgi:4-diphosphocytidyl-2-C-methyl-D-erythritol kinase|uniref:4-(cytidine 5'-diphospho)-2-C-methyl-D-erythritol kinase n=1 Tax=Variovorax sp. LG9.2 TaxID=3048626 RepID=UPI0019A04E3C|nr:4-(cytidine 5'-diphospho)-2-C-methyl-D-erythritol kinase [Variovorax sp. LG9.2]MBC7392445.1 4-(cytidine 5'-diphospho)-2-C-methyl-D-erythritol kinase [Variovorax sp.]MEB0056230.1 4-(cytidine 5'-diphospho)-2-C-methyl-D-erythritol kinase [Variovorax sp. LG9.2]
MKALYDLPAPAKLNLFLHITGRRADGYHLLQSVFMMIDWCDTLHVELRSDGGLSREDLTTQLPAEDLILRAARALQRFASPGQGAHIGVAKDVPAEAGMGGGSSDAATCLLALNRLWKLHLPLARLEEIGLALGADVPFFLRGRNAWVEGIGDQITAIDVPAARFAVAKPAEGLETRLIFEASDLNRATPAAIISGFAADSAASGSNSGKSGFAFGHNDLQPVAQRLCPAVSDAIDWLGAQGLSARMTGSGSAVFAAMPHDVELADAPEGWRVRKCSNLAVHPLVGWAAD